jgi:hypothetical protein
VIFCLIGALAIWGIALTVYKVAKNSKMTAEKALAYAESVDLRKLSAMDRAKAIKKLEDMLNAMSPEERQRARMEEVARRWFEEMTEEEKARFIEATMPSGFKQMLAAFEELPEEKRRKAVEDALRRLKDTQEKLRADGANINPSGTNRPLVLSPELQAKVRTMGLKAFYSQSSAQTKAELAPVLEELQKTMESGRPFRGR